ncbi:MAG TPA: hypothetical protein VFB04_03860 [Terriglobales bacterium]|nr:hypothetical protein [Terriglobales bacterium]
MSPRNSGIPLVFFCVAILLVPAFLHAQNASFAQKLYGRWYTYPLGNPNTDPVRHEFRHNSENGSDEMIVTRVCPGDPGQKVARAVSPIEVSEDTIRVLKNASDNVPGRGTAVCQAGITAGSLAYSFSEDGQHLILTDPGGNPDILELAPEATAQDKLVPKRLYGTWILPPADGKEFRMLVRLVFYTTADRQDRVRKIAVCSKGTDSLVAHVDSEIALEKDRITVPESATHQEQQGTFTCTASIAAGAYRYEVAPSGMTMTLSAAGSKPLTLTRDQNSGLN